MTRKWGASGLLAAAVAMGGCAPEEDVASSAPPCGGAAVGAVRALNEKDPYPQGPLWSGGDLEGVEAFEGDVDALNEKDPWPQGSLWRGGDLEDTESFDGTAPVGRTVRGTCRSGAAMGTVRVVAVPSQDALPRYRVTAGTRNLCEGQGDGLALALPGHWDAAGVLHSDPAHPTFTLACSTGVAAKCALWGYAPGARGPDGRSLAPYYAACVQAARAQYVAGTGASYTRAGTLVDVYDSAGVLPHGTPLPFESLWGEHGLLCLAHPRYAACTDTLAAQGVHASVEACPDPSVSGWPAGALIAIASDAGDAPGVCEGPAAR